MAIVFIPTRNRRFLLEKALPKWRQQQITEVVLVVEKWEFGRTKALIENHPRVSIMKLPHANQGVNYARQFIVEEADRLGLDRIIMADDDHYVHPDSDVNRLFEWKGLNTLGLGVAIPFYGLMFGNKTLANEDRPLMSKGALGGAIFSLNIKRVLAAGNFDPVMYSGWGDDELVREAMVRLGATTYVHAGVKGVCMAKRYTKGGMNDFFDENPDKRLKGQSRSHRIIYERWGPRYVNDPDKKLRFRWKLFMDDHVPDWEARIDWEKK